MNTKKETCCHSNTNEKPLANAGVKKISKEGNNNNNNNNKMTIIRTFGEKKYYKYLGIVEADTIK